MICNFYKMLKCVKEIGFTLCFQGKSGGKTEHFSVISKYLNKLKIFR